MIAINCDLGEWESSRQTEWMMGRIQQANVACGGHAGGPQQIALCKRLAESNGVRLGMHPGVGGNRGRGDVSNLSVEEFSELLWTQYAVFLKYAGKPMHTKLHGSLYHLTESDELMRSVYLDFAIKTRLPVMALAGGQVLAEFKERGGEAISEGFLDRHYREDGSLVERKDGGMVATAEEAIDRWRSITSGEGIRAVSGNTLKLPFNSLCVHSDSSILQQLFDHFQGEDLMDHQS